MIRVRFAAVPTAALTVGTARIALLNFLHARRHGGHLLLRFADLAPRATAEHAASIGDELRWLGIAWDATLRQSERRALYQDSADKLKRAGRLYPCFESEAELRAKRDHRVKRGRSPVYDRAMLQLTQAQQEAAEAGGKRPYWRFLLSGRTVEWRDMVLGHREVALRSLSDPIVLQADGTPTRAFAGIVDDLATGITDLVRSETQVPPTAVAIDLYQALGGDPSGLRFAHLPPLEDAGEKRLARRVDARTLRSLRHDGVEPAALVACLACIGTPLPPATASLLSLAANFDLSRFTTQPAPFKAATLLALNRQVLRSLDFAAVADRLPAGATDSFWLAVRGELDLLNEARGWWDVVAGSIVPPEIPERALLETALELLPPEPWNGTVWHDWTAALAGATGRSGEALVSPLRLALTGEDGGPELGALLPLIGRARAMHRLQVAAH
ncbi:MAG TPA: glutamate--tRNA ligase family protein [Acetobacteraceae bacterium]|nr:glutamate--tRNA ligase family protein [Acetobacteraceae bacterium]